MKLLSASFPSSTFLYQGSPSYTSIGIALRTNNRRTPSSSQDCEQPLEQIDPWLWAIDSMIEGYGLRLFHRAVIREVTAATLEFAEIEQNPYYRHPPTRPSSHLSRISLLRHSLPRPSRKPLRKSATSRSSTMPSPSNQLLSKPSPIISASCSASRSRP